MIKTIEIATDTVVVKTETKKINLPETAKYYSMMDDGRFFPRGLILFGIAPKYPNSTTTYLLVMVERGKQDYNDFVPTKDCWQTDWIKESKFSLRKMALAIMTDSFFEFTEFKEIKEDEFEQKRMELLNVYQSV